MPEEQLNYQMLKIIIVRSVISTVLNARLICIYQLYERIYVLLISYYPIPISSGYLLFFNTDPDYWRKNKKQPNLK